MKPKWFALGALVLGLVPAMNAQFNQCPPSPKTDFDGFTFTGCLSLIIANADGTFTVKEDTSQPTNDAGHGERDDALIGFQNNSGAPISAIRIAGCESSLDFTACFAFDGSNSLVNNNVFCPVANPGPTGYEGPGVTFTDLANTKQPCDTGTVNFSPPIAPGKSAYFFLERPVHATVSLPAPATAVPTVQAVFDQAAATSKITTGMPIQVVGTGFGNSTSDSATVTIGTEPVPVLIFINSTNLIVQVPVEQLFGGTSLIVSYKGQSSAPFPIVLVPLAPEIEPFQSQNGSSFYDTSNNPITAAHPATPGSQVYLLAIGLGTTNPPQVTGTKATAQAPTTQPVQVMVGSKMVTPDYAGLFVGGTPGVYQVSFKVPVDAAMGNQTVTISVGGLTSNSQTLVVAPPVPVINAIVNGATFKAGANPAAANSFVSLFGTDFGTENTTGNIFPATTFNGVSVLVNGAAIPLYFVVGTGGQINIVLPSELGSSGSATVEVKTADGTSAPFTLQLAADSVGIFRIADPSKASRENGAVLFSNTAWKVMPLSMATALGLPSCASVTTASVCGKPAKVGDQIQIYLTGLGKATPNGDPNGKVLATGTLAPTDGSVLYKTVETPVVKIGGVPAVVSFSGIAPGNAGQYQINVAVPDGVKPNDDVTLEIEMPDGSKDSVTIAITS
jgi:uncharacterized protein (TIGR03437 family)